MPAGRSGGSTESSRTMPAIASRSSRKPSPARGRRRGTPPAAAVEPLPAAIAMMPIAPVRATCVPPQAERSKSCDVDQAQRRPRASDSLRSGSAAASSASANRIVTGRSSQTTRLASSSARAISRRRHLAREIDRGRCRRRGGSSRCARLKQPIERGRQDVLAGVLLHVIEAPRASRSSPCTRLAGRERRARRRARRRRRRRRRRRARARRRACRCRTAGRPRSDRTPSDRARRAGAAVVASTRVDDRGVELAAGRDRCSRGARSSHAS